MAQKLLVIVAVLGLLCVSVFGQAKPSIQGVWRPVEVTVTNPKPSPAGFGKGTHTNLQPALLIFTAKHYSLTIDTAVKPRPTTPFKVPGKPTAEEMLGAWGPFVAAAGTYELSGTTLLTNPIVAKDPAAQGKEALRANIKLDGNNLWLTALENPQGKIEYPTTVKLTRVE